MGIAQRRLRKAGPILLRRRGAVHYAGVRRTSLLPARDAINAILSQLRIFGGLTEAQLATLFERLELWALEPGEVVFQKGDEPQHIYIVKSGQIDLQIGEGDVVIRKHELKVGECLGEASLMSMHKHTSTAIAAEPSEVIVLSRKALICLQREDLRLFALLMMNLARELARRLYLTDQMLLHATGGGGGAPEATPRASTPGT
jgi:CRP-like cAMP-binding protein